ncbi:MmcB family DNA repair protein [Amorphus sp. 3PC139-8]|uniref:MmcB family DNA repair protein n=1 Tax=Amorphus sp. 3PC139-8 TaxID=2735676 RepID=UPI00345E043C
MSLDPAPVPQPNLPVDGRQSERALTVRRGTGRLLRRLGFSILPEVGLASGRRADLVALDRKGEIWIVEIKSSPEDLRADTKWPAYRLHCDRLFFATLPEVASAPFPQEAGLILTDGFEAEIVREAPTHKLAGATRKAMTLAFAQLAAGRLHLLEDPEAGKMELPAW